MTFVERLVVDDETKQTVFYDEHIVRYQFAADFVKNKTILDIASGSGYGAALLAKNGAKTVLGLDADKKAIEKAKQTYQAGNLEFKQGQAVDLGLGDKSIDLITSFETIEHLTDAEGFLKELARVLTDDGLVFISTPNKTVFQQKNPFHIQEFSKEEFKTVLQKYFSVVRVFEQKNGLASIINTGVDEGTVLLNDSNSEALYFIAVCSKKEILEKFRDVSSINVRALKNWENNPGWKLVNSVYKVLQKLRIKN